MEDINYISSNEVSEIFKILSHPIRVRIVVSLASRPKNYTSLQIELNEPRTGNLNFHLQKLSPLIEKQNDLYKLNPLGQKSVELIDQYTSERVHGTSSKIVKERVNYWENFLNINESFAPLVFFTIFTLLGLMIWIGYFFGLTHNISNLLVMAIGAITWRWCWQRVYLSSRPKSTFWFIFNSYMILSFVFIVYYVFSPINDLEILSLRLRITGSTIQDSLLASFLFELSGLLRDNLDMFRYILIFVLCPLIGLGWSYVNFNEMPTFAAVLDGSGERPVVNKSDYENNLTSKQILTVFVAILIIEFIFFSLIMLILVAIPSQHRLIFLMSINQLLFIFSLSLLKAGVLYYLLRYKEWKVEQIISSKYLKFFVLLITYLELEVINLIHKFIFENLDSSFYYHAMQSASYLSISILVSFSIISVLVLLGINHYKINSIPRITNPISVTFLLIVTIFILHILQIHLPSIEIRVFFVITLALMIVGSLTKIFTGRKKQFVMLILPVLALVYVISLIIQLGFPNGSEFIAIVVAMTLLSYYGPKAFAG
jgi:hypothetical protein